MITEFKKLIKKLILLILIVFSGFNVFPGFSTAHAASYVTNENFSKVVKSEIFLKTMAKNKGKVYVSCNLFRYIRNYERIKRFLKEYWSIDRKFNIFIFSGGHCVNIARNIAWDMFKRKARYFIANEKQSLMDSAYNVESLIFLIKNKVLPVYNDYLLKMGEESVKNLDEEDLNYICTEACRMYYCYALDFKAYVNYCYLYGI